MKLSDSQIDAFVSKVLHLGPGKRKEFEAQADRLIEKLTKQIANNTTFKVKGFRKTGSLVKGTVLKPRGENGVDADIGVFLDVSEAEKNDVAGLHEIIRKLLKAAYPSKFDDDFQIQPRTLGIHFRESGLDVDLVPIIPIPGQDGYGWQPSSQNGSPVKTSIKGQLDFIAARKRADPRYRTLVRLAKNWRNHQELDKFRSFSIELILAFVYDRDGAAASLEDGLRRFFYYIAESELRTPISFAENGKISKFPTAPVVILDPVNSENNVTMRLTEQERIEIVAAAQTAWETIETASWKNAKGDTLDLWKEIMGRSFTVEKD